MSRKSSSSRTQTGRQPSPAPHGASAPREFYWKRFAALFGIGFIGVLSLIPLLAEGARQQLEQMPEIGLSLPAFVALSLLNPLIMLALTVAMGIQLAPQLGLRSYLDERVTTGQPLWPRLRRDLPIALLLGAIGGVLLLGLDALFALWIGPELQLGAQEFSPQLSQTLMGLLYGGITEELIMRWGVMSFLAWFAARLIGRGRPPGPVLMWIAVGGAAIIFGVGHLPAVATMLPLTTPVIIRTVSLNAIGGMIFGWLFWRRALEAGMVAHASFHVVFTLASLVT